jgi:hypothetical protein
MEKVTVLDNLLPNETNLDILNALADHPCWEIAKDQANECKLNRITQQPTGFLLKSVHEGMIEQPGNLILYSKIIFDIVNSKIKFKKFKLNRVYWNLYTPVAFPNEHQDNEKDNFTSIIYNPHTTDGGTIIDGKFYQDVMGQAKIFKSNVLHKGVAPKKDLARFNLNIVIEHS